MNRMKILGTGCANCKKLYALVMELQQEQGWPGSVVEVKDIPEIMSYGVMRTPALVVNEKVVLQGRVPRKPELSAILQACIER